MKRIVALLAVFAMLAVCLNGQIGLRDPGFVAKLNETTAASASPSDISGLQIWLKPESLSGANGDLVQTWTESSGNSYSASQSTSGSRPYLTNNILGSYEGVVFGSGKFMIFNNGATNISANVAGLTVVVVGKRSPLNQFGSFVAFMTATDGTSRYLAGAEGSSSSLMDIVGRRLDADSAQISDTFTYSQNKFLSWIFIGDYADSAAYIYTNNVSAVSDTTWTSGNANSQNTSSAKVYLGCGPNSSYPISGIIVEVIVYNKVLSAGDRTTIDTYLTGKYGAYSGW